MGGSGDIRRAHAIADGAMDGLLDGERFLFELEGVPQHQGNAEDGAIGIGDPSPGDVGG